MSATTLHLAVITKRMLTRREAAIHCGRNEKQFDKECPVEPIRFANGDLRFDLRDLDAWLDSLKNNAQDSDELVRRLGAA